MPARRANVTRQEEEKECKWVEVKERRKERKAKERAAMLLEEISEREGVDREREREREKERERERKACILKAAVTPVTSHLSNPAPT